MTKISWRGWIGAAALAIMACGPTGASAAVYGFGGITNNNAGDIVIGESQLKLEVVDAGGGVVDFIFSNNVGQSSNIAEIYFSDPVPQLLLPPPSSVVGSCVGTCTNTPVFVVGSGNLPGLPSGPNNPFAQGTVYVSDADNPAPQNGVNEANDRLTISWLLATGSTYAMVVDQLNNAGLQVGVHVTAFASGGSESFINTVPLPAAAWLLLGGVGGLGWVSRRRKAATA